ncbi:IS110 family transposase [Massilia violaceinigra]|uniref:IS110 family transposase n=1 Tax=Massilia violaceinigra TaxID=2045208 RepID=A0ABY3ZXN4_9BURK|nr:IS110 family transposase [Massilia violaceinigra]UOD27227.1 IS110 family transposase [Massilia violaceinigra]
MSHQLPVLDPLATFVDVGSEHMHVSIGGNPPRVFGTVTSQLNALRDWLLDQGVHSVAMEATGVYWLPLFNVLEQGGLVVRMINGRQTRNLPGRKTDMADSQWGATLHMHGLLRAGFVPPADTRRLQDYLRLRADHVALAGSCIQLMQKAFERMNIKLHDVISSLAGSSGMAVARAIAGGERSPEVLLQLCSAQIRARKEQAVVKSLCGTWEEEHLFALRHAIRSWDHYQQLIADCDARIAAILPPPDQTAPPPPPPGKERKARPAGQKPGGANAPDIANLREILAHMCGTDLTRLPALTHYSVLQLVGEVGTDLSAWPTEKHFVSWAGLAPRSKDSGKRKSNAKAKCNRTGRLFCMVAQSLARSKDMALGGFYRRLRGRRGGLIATKAVARKLATWVWRLMVKGEDYVEKGLAHYAAQVQKSKEAALRRLAKELGQTLVPAG